MIEKIQNFFIGSYEELKKVVWPSRQEVISHTVIVIASIAVSMAIISALDYGLTIGVQWLLYRGQL